MRELKLSAAILAMALAASCGGNNTTAGVTITSPAANPETVLENGNQQFSASVSGVSTTTVYWQVCLPSATTTVQPTSCTPIPGVTTGTGGLTGYGTITQNGLYTAPATIPSPNAFVVMAASTVDYAAFAVINVRVATQVQVQMNPTSVSMAAGEHFQFAATVTGASNTSVTWAVNGNDGGTATDGYICPNPLAPQPCTPGEYFAPTQAPGSVTIKATSVADTTASASASVDVTATATPALTGINPSAVGEGAAQLDVYIEGSNLLNTTLLQVGNATLPQSAMTWLTGSLVRATIPGTLLQQPGNLTLTAVSQNGDTSVTSFNLAVNPMRPALVALSPDTTQQGAGGTTVALTGGYYVPGRTLTQFNGSNLGVTTSYLDSRHLSVSLPAGSSNTPGLYSVFVQNSDAAEVSPPIASMTAKNLAVTPDPSSIATVPLATVGVGAGPTAVAIDYATGTALVANTGENTVSVLNLATNSANPNKIAVGNAPTGIAVDDLLSPPLALVVNNADQTVTTINLATMSVVGTPLSVALTTVTPVPLPYSVGINPMTHHAIVTYQNTNEATMLDLSSGTPTILGQLGGQFANYGTGNNPAVAVDERLNWAVVTPGGSGVGVINVVDLGRNAIPGVDSGRLPQMVATAQFSVPDNTTLGVGINSETHQAIFTDPNAPTLTSFDIFNDTVNQTRFTLNGVPVNEQGYVAAAATPLTNEAIAVNSGSSAVVVELDNGNVLQTVNGLGNNPIAAAIDPASNEAVIVNQGDGTVSILSLGAVRTNQIVEENPEMTFTSATPVTITVTGSGFAAGAQVRLDQTPLATTTVTSSCTTTPPVTCRQLTATVPVTLLGSARRFALDVLNSDATVSNVMDFNVVQPVVVGTRPVGVAVDAERHMAVVTNAGDSTVDLVALSPATPVGNNGGTAGAVGVVGTPISVGGTPEGVGVIPRLGLAVSANYNGNSFSVIDETQVVGPKTTNLCQGCVEPIGVGVDSDNGSAVITFSVPQRNIVEGAFNVIGVSTAVGGSAVLVGQLPTGVAIDPTLDYAAVAASQTGSIDLEDLQTLSPVGPGSIANFTVPTGIIFDPLNQVFVTANSLQNTVVLVDPSTFATTSISVGINPTSVDYDFQTSTLATVNSTSNTISVLDYDCPPLVGSTACSNPLVRAVVSAGEPQPASSVVIGVNALGIDSMLGVIVTVDPDNNRVLLVPLPN